MAAAAGVLWPVIAVGLAQMWVIGRVAARLRGAAVPATNVPEPAMVSGSC